MELKDYWAALVAGWKLIAAALVLALLTGVTASALIPTPVPSYSALREVFLVIPDAQPDSEVPQSTASRTPSYAKLASGSVMADRVQKQLAEEPGDARPAVGAFAVPETSVIQLTVTDGDQDRADEYADAYVALLPTVINELEDRQDGSEVTASLITSLELPVDTGASGTVRIMLLAVILGLGLGILAALTRWTARHRHPGTGTPDPAP